MAEILGLGLTHYPPLIAPDEDKAIPLRRALRGNPNIPEALKNLASWPKLMRIECGKSATPWNGYSGGFQR